MAVAPQPAIDHVRTHGIATDHDLAQAVGNFFAVEDELTALHRAQPVILVMPFGSTGSFTDKEWANGIRPNDGWVTRLETR